MELMSNMEEPGMSPWDSVENEEGRPTSREEADTFKPRINVRNTNSIKDTHHLQRFAVSGIRSNIKVSSFPVTKICKFSMKLRELLADDFETENAKADEAVPTRESVPAVVLPPTEMVGLTFQDNHEVVKTSGDKSEGRPSHFDRKELRAMRREEIQRHINEKPNICDHNQFDETKNSGQDQSQPIFGDMSDVNDLNAIDLAKKLLHLEDNLMSIRTKFNEELLQLAYDKIDVKNIVDTQKERVAEISSTLGDGAEPPEILLKIAFCSEELTEKLTNGKLASGKSAFDLYIRGTVFDSAYLLQDGISLDEDLKAEARVAIKRERSQVINAIEARANKFDMSLNQLRLKQADVALQLKMGDIQLSVYERQIKILFDFFHEERRVSTLSGDEYQNAIDDLKLRKESSLKSLQVPVPLSISYVFCFAGVDGDDHSDSDDDPMKLFSKTELKTFRTARTELQNAIDKDKSQIQSLIEEKKSLTTSMRKLNESLSQERKSLEEIEISKFGKIVGPSTLDINPVPENDDGPDSMTQSKMESCFQKKLRDVQKEQQRLKDKLLCVTNENTTLLNELALLRVQHMRLNDDIKQASNSGKNKYDESDAAEYSHFLDVERQQKEVINLLKLEIESLRTKRGKNCSGIQEALNTLLVDFNCLRQLLNDPLNTHRPFVQGIHT